MSRLLECLPLILQHEGGYSDNPKDPGGATNLGVTQGTLSDWLGRPASKDEVRHLTGDKVAPIYEGRYWKAAHCPELPAGLDYMIFDLAVNSGVSRACRYLQGAAGVAEDGAVGPVTLAAVKAHSVGAMIDKVSARRDAFYRNLTTFPTFGRGWLHRLSEVTATAHQMALEHPA